MDTVLEGRVFFRDRLIDCCIGIENGRIAAIKQGLKGEENYNYGRLLILPGGIDSHVHLREPGATHKEDFLTGTQAAACGGVTTVLDMPNNKPPILEPRAFAEKFDAVASKAVVDFGLFAGTGIERDISGLKKLTRLFKLYTASTTGGLLIPELENQRRIVEKIRDMDGILSIHCEDENLLCALGNENGPRNLNDHDHQRPEKAEADSIRQVLSFHSGENMHICHLSSVEGLTLLAGSDATCEVNPAHIFLNKEKDLGTHGKLNPPLRSRATQSSLLQALCEGGIDIVASDHAPHTLSEKDDDFETAPSGVPGVETMLPMLLELVKDGKMGIERLVEVSSQRPAEIFNLENKGRIEVGSDADLMVVDMRATHKIRADKLHSKCGWTPFEGMMGIFPKATFLRGELVAEDGECVGRPGFGQYVSG